MRHLLTITAIAVALFFTLIITGWVGLFHTPPGRALLAQIIESELGDALDSTAEIGALKGAPPGLLVLDGITLNDDAGPWLTVRRLELRWRPLALLRGRILIDEARLSHARLLREPPPGESEDKAARIDLSIDAPNLSIAALEIIDLRINLGGEMKRLDGAGAAHFDGPDMELRLTLSGAAGDDEVQLVFEKAPRSDRFFVDASLKTGANGVIASLAGLDGPLRLRASADSTIAAAALNIEGRLSGFGDLEAAFSSNFEDFTGFDADIRFAPGERVSRAPELAAPITLAARFDFDRRGGAMAIRSFKSALGEATGALTWRTRNGGVDELSAAIKAEFTTDYRPPVQDVIGTSATLNAHLKWRRDDYALTGTLIGEKASLSLAEGRTDLEQELSGAIIAILGENERLPGLLAQGAELRSDFSIASDAPINVQNLSLITEIGARLRGDGAFAPPTNNLTFIGDFSLNENALNALSPGLGPSGEFTGDVDVSGPLDRLTMLANFETPALKTQDGAMPPMSVKAALAGLPARPTGEIVATARDGAPRRLEAQLRSNQAGLIRAPKLIYSGRRFTLEGAGAFDPKLQTVTLEIVYAGEDGAEPWPGVFVSGDAAINGVLSRDGALNDLSANVQSLSVNDFSVASLSMNAAGPPGAVDLSLAGATLFAPAIGAVSNYEARAQIALRGTPVIMLQEFEALIADNAARLTTPATIRLDDGVTIDNLRLAYGATGTIAFDGALTQNRWRAAAALRDVNIPNADGQISLTLALDTDTDTPAHGDFKLRSLLLDDDNAAIAGKFNWDGTAILLSDAGADERLDMRISLPARLTRAPRIGVDMAGPVNGYFRFDDDIQAIAAYLPPTFQTVEGRLAANLTIDGDMAAPVLNGAASLRDGAYTEIETGFSIAGLHADARAKLNGEGSAVLFSGGARGADQKQADTITFQGALNLGDNPSIDLSVTLTGAELSAEPVSSVRADGVVSIAGPFDALKADGRITIDELNAEITTRDTAGFTDIEVIAFNNGADEPPAPPQRKASNLAFAISINADDRVFIRGRGLESEWSANVSAENGREEPQILGNLSLRRGWLDFSGRRFDLTRGVISFDRLSQNNPLLDIRAELAAGDGVTAAIVISGRANEPSISLTSTPARPPEDVMSLVLFGKPAQELSAFESIQTAEALASLSGVGPFGGEGLTGRLRNAVGLDLLNVDIDPENGGGSLTVGKYVAEGFFVSATQDAEGKNGSVRVKYEITDNITIESELEQNGDQTVSANWEKDF